MGGCIAQDVHGKNHHHAGSFCPHVVSLTLLTAKGTREVSPEKTPALFKATAGGLGQTGVNVISRLMGMILVAMAVQFMANGVRGLFPPLGR